MTIIARVMLLGLCAGLAFLVSPTGAVAQHCLWCDVRWTFDGNGHEPEHRFDSSGDQQRECFAGNCHNEFRDGHCGVPNHQGCGLTSIEQVRDLMHATESEAAWPEVLAEFVAGDALLELSDDGLELHVRSCTGTHVEAWTADTLQRIASRLMSFTPPGS